MRGGHYDREALTRLDSGLAHYLLPIISLTPRHLKSHIALSQITMLANVLPSVYICHQNSIVVRLVKISKVHNNPPVMSPSPQSAIMF